MCAFIIHAKLTNIQKEKPRKTKNEFLLKFNYIISEIYEQIKRNNNKVFDICTFKLFKILSIKNCMVAELLWGWKNKSEEI